MTTSGGAVVVAAGAAAEPAPPRTTRPARDPLLALLAAVPLLATLVAFLVDDSSATTMTLLMVMSFGCALIGFIRIYLGIGRRNHLPLLILYGALLFWFYFPGLKGAFSDVQWHKAAAKIRINNDHALTALLAINLFAFLIALTQQVRMSFPLARLVRRWLGARPAQPTQRVYLVVLLGMMAGLTFYVIAAGGPVRAFHLMLASRAEKKPWDREGYEGSTLSLLDVMVEAGLVAFSAIGMHLALDSDQPRLRKLALGMAALATMAWIAIERGTRSILLEVALPPLGMYYARVSIGLTAARLRRTAVLLMLLAGLIVAANAQAKYRRTAVLDNVSFEVTNNDFFSQTALAIAVQEAENRHFHDSVLLHIISGPVPRVLWKNKPVMEGMFVFTEYVWGFDTRKRGGNTTPSVVGEYYMNWGWLGVLEIGLVMGLIVRLLDLTFMVAGTRDIARFGALGIMAYFFIDFRMLSFGFFPPMAMTVMVAAIIARLPWLQRGVPPPRRT